MDAPAGRLPAVPGFEVQSVLGTGGYGVVVSATRASDGRVVAVKVAPPGIAAERLARETAALAAVGASVAPRVEGAGALDDGGRWLALEVLPGPPLSSVLERAEAGLPADEARRRVHALLTVVGRLHASGWLHLDLKPENLFVDGEGLRLIDFGNATRAVDGASEPAGTADYMSPEQADGRAVDVRSDLYSVGVIAFELATGRTPFFGGAHDVLTAHRDRRPPRPSALVATAAPLEPLVLALLAKRPEDRPPSAAAALALLGAGAVEAAALPRPSLTPPGAGERRTVGLVFLETQADATQVRDAAVALEADVAALSGTRWALAFDSLRGENLAVRALTAARVLHSKGLAPRLRVDVAPLTVQRRPDGARRYVGAPLIKKDSWPSAAGAPGVELSPLAERLSGETEWSTPTMTSSSPSSPLGAAEPPMYGRDAELDEVLRAGGDARLGRPVLARALGEAGSGKSRFGREVARRLGALDFTALFLKGREVVQGEGGALYRELVLAALGGGDAGAEAAARVLGPRLDVGQRDAVLRALGFAMGWLAPDDAQKAAASFSHAVLRANLAVAAGELLRASAGARPLAVVLDDAHLVEDEVLDALEYATLAEGHARVAGLALGRPDFARARPSFGARAAQSPRLQLGPLSPEAAAQACRWLLRPAENVADAVVQRLIERAAFTPRLLVELIRGLRLEGLIAQRTRGGGFVVVTDVVDRVPELPVIEWLARRELEALGAELTGHARIAALLGSFSADAMTAVVQALEAAGLGALAPLDARAGLGRLLERRLLAQDADGTHRFRLPAVRDVVEREVPAADAKAIHRAAWSHYAGAAAMPARARLPRMARHAQACGEPAAAADAWYEAGLLAQHSHALVEADVELSRALEVLAGADARRLEALRTRGVVRYRLARYGDALKDLDAAHAAAQALNDERARLEVLLWWATVLDWTSDFAAAREKIATARAVFDAAPVPALEATLLYNEGRSAARFDSPARAAAILQRAAALCDPSDDAAYETAIETNVALLYLLPGSGDLDGAEAALASVRAQCDARGDRFHLGSAYLNSRTLWLARGDLERGIADQRRAAAIGYELGEQSLEYTAQCNVAELVYLAGDPHRAVDEARAALNLEVRYPEVAASPLAKLIFARASFADGDVGTARSTTREIRTALETADAAGQLLPNETLLLEAVELGLEDGGSDRWCALAERARAAGFADEALEVVGLWARRWRADALAWASAQAGLEGSPALKRALSRA